MKKTPLKRKTPLERKGRERFAKLVDRAYREWIRGLPCCTFGSSAGFASQAAHVRTKATGTGDRNNLVPLCSPHHREQHRIGIKSFQKKYAVDLAAIARDLTTRYLREHPDA